MIQDLKSYMDTYMKTSYLEIAKSGALTAVIVLDDLSEERINRILFKGKLRRIETADNTRKVTVISTKIDTLFVGRIIFCEYYGTKVSSFRDDDIFSISTNSERFFEVYHMVLDHLIQTMEDQKRPELVEALKSCIKDPENYYIFETLPA